MTKWKDIFEYIIAQENAMRVPIQVLSGWDFNFREHVRISTLYKHSQFADENDKSNKPFKNIVKPVLNLQYRSEDIDVKDIHIYVDDPEKYHLSFLVKKYHDDVFVLENDLDSYIDQLKESKIDYGGGLSKKLPSQARPEVVALQAIAFCDQADMMGGPIAVRHFFTPDKLREKKGKWDDKAIDDVILASEDSREPDINRDTSVKTPGKYIEVYEIHGTLPLRFLEETDSDEWVSQMQIVAFYRSKEKSENWFVLYKGRESKWPFKLVQRDAIFGRALGAGGVEELFDAQIWTNYDEIRIKELLDAAAKVIFQTGDTAYANRNKIHDMENLEITITEKGEKIEQIPTAAPVNIALFERSVREWYQSAQLIGASTDPLLGMQPPSGTPFRLQERVVQEGKGTHDYRRGKFAKHLEEVYRDWIIPHIAKKIVQGAKFLSELSSQEMQSIAEQISENEVNRRVKEKILNGELILKEEMEELRLKIRSDFQKGGNKKFIEVLKDEMEGVEFKVKIDIAGKQKDLAAVVDSLSNIFRQVLATPQVLNDPRMAKLLNTILESSGFSPIDFGTIPVSPIQGLPPTPDSIGALQQPTRGPVKQLLKV